MIDVCFWTIVTKEFEEPYQKVVHQLETFHPDIPRIKFTEEDLIQADQDDPAFYFNDMYGDKLRRPPATYYYFNQMLGKQYKKVIHIDADVLILAPLDELFEDYDVAVLEDRNMGVNASTSQEFNNEWAELSRTDSYKYLDGDQSTFNIVSSREKYKLKVLGEQSYYSTVATYWSEKIELKDNRLYYEGKPIALLHFAGRWGLPIKKLIFSYDDPHFPAKPEVIDYINKIYE